MFITKAMRMLAVFVTACASTVVLAEPGLAGWKVFGHGPMVAADRNVVKAGDCSASMTTTAIDAGRVYMDQSIPVEPYRGKVIL
jgi:hypothetical protein